MWKRHQIRQFFFISIAVLAAFLAVFYHWRIARFTNPNIVIVVVDTLRFDHLGIYGYPLPTDLSLSHFYEQSTVFEQCRAPSSWTLPSTSSLLTGLRSSIHNVTEIGDVLDGELTTIAELLGHLGYETVGYSHNLQISRKAGFAQGFDSFVDFKGDVLEYPDVSEAINPVLEWLKKREDTPFFLYLHPMNCHGPYRVPKSQQKALLGRSPINGFKYYDDLMADLMWRGKISRRAEVTEKRIQSLVEQYDTAIHYTLSQVARLFERLRILGIWEETLIILTSDHGEELYDHGGFSHAYSLYEEVVHVPLMIKLPAQREAHRSSALVSLLDIFPTILDVIDIAFPVAFDGVSLLPILRKEKESGVDKDRILLLESAWKNRFVGTGIVRGKKKLIRVERNYEGKRNIEMLFDLKKDPDEEQDLKSTFPDMISELKNILEQKRKDTHSFPLKKKMNIKNELNIKTLRALGYILGDESADDGEKKEVQLRAGSEKEPSTTSPSGSQRR